MRRSDRGRNQNLYASVIVTRSRLTNSSRGAVFEEISKWPLAIAILGTEISATTAAINQGMAGSGFRWWCFKFERAESTAIFEQGNDGEF